MAVGGWREAHFSLGATHRRVIASGDQDQLGGILGGQREEDGVEDGEIVCGAAAHCVEGNIDVVALPRPLSHIVRVTLPEMGPVLAPLVPVH